MVENKEDIFNDVGLDGVNIYKMKYKGMYLVVTIAIFIIIGTLKFKYKIDSELLAFIAMVNFLFLAQAHFGGLGINNSILISKDFIKIGYSKAIEWENICKIGFEPLNRTKTMYIVVCTKCPEAEINKDIMVISNKKDLREKIKFICDYYNIDYFNNVKKENWFTSGWWNVLSHLLN